ncbi:MAG: AAA family ATPase [Pseudomonadota bacterium]
MRAVIFGNSGSGKSTLAKAIGEVSNSDILDLDTVAWAAAAPPVRRPLTDSQELMREFMQSTEDWVIEGCYGDLIEFAMTQATHAVFLNPGVATCIDNARNRPWEPHKYESREAQDANLAMLTAWIDDYVHRGDEFSLRRHQSLFDGFAGHKREVTTNERDSWLSLFVKA